MSEREMLVAMYKRLGATITDLPEDNAMSVVATLTKDPSTEPSVGVMWDSGYCTTTVYKFNDKNEVVEIEVMS